MWRAKNFVVSWPSWRDPTMIADGLWWIVTLLTVCEDLRMYCLQLGGVDAAKSETYYKGHVSNFFVFDYALTDSEMEQIANGCTISNCIKTKVVTTNSLWNRLRILSACKIEWFLINHMVQNNFMKLTHGPVWRFPFVDQESFLSDTDWLLPIDLTSNQRPWACVLHRTVVCNVPRPREQRRISFDEKHNSFQFEISTLGSSFGVF